MKNCYGRIYSEHAAKICEQCSAYMCQLTNLQDNPLWYYLMQVCVCRCVCTVCLNWKAVIKCVDLSTISSSSQRQWRTNRSTAMSHQAPRITTPPSISLSLPPSTSTQLSITLSASCYTFPCPTLSKLPTNTTTLPEACARYKEYTPPPHTLLEIRAQFPPLSETLLFISTHLAIDLPLHLICLYPLYLPLVNLSTPTCEAMG